MSHSFQMKPGQRWVSEAEPELGLGTLLQVEHGRVQVLFSGTGETRVYSQENAPLKRARFRVGDLVESHDGLSFRVERVTEESGLLRYHGEGQSLIEAALADRLSTAGPVDQLLAGMEGSSRELDLRVLSLAYRHRMAQSPVRGFLGPRIDLIPHQLHIADETCRRLKPRVLLSDEVGLGKTIEACLILHRLWLSGRASRILILVPQALAHQWFVELLRKFHLLVHLYDEERCLSLEGEGGNPFLDEQLVLCSIDFLTEHPRRAAQAVEAGWDLLIVDEAHHLEWSQEAPQPAYQVVEALAARTRGVLLLTATPEQLGLESHFARLRLLDPERYENFEAFLKEAEDFPRLARLADRLHGTQELESGDLEMLSQLFARIPDQMPKASDLQDPQRREVCWRDVVDCHGPGRVVFRNTRASMPGFPARRFQPAPLRHRTAHEAWLEQLAVEFAVEEGDRDLRMPALADEDPRVLWLAELLDRTAPDKVLLICHSQERALALDEVLRRRSSARIGVFHEGQTLLQRDRQAAWFAEPEGARILICSEIGSEGRNFQFARHLVLLDLPLNPELLEQRIGRLDRIGQTREIQVHVPYGAGAPGEVLARWYHEGLNAFEAHVRAGNEVMRRLGETLRLLASEYPELETAERASRCDALVREAAVQREQLESLLSEGRDRLLEWNSHDPARANELVEAIAKLDVETALEPYLLDILDHYGVTVEECAPRTYRLDPRGIRTDAFPAIPEEGLLVTLDRARAVSREDVTFLSWDHPMVTGAMELLLGSREGTLARARLAGASEWMVEGVFVLEAVADSRLHLDRFLPPTPIRIVVSESGEDVTAQQGFQAWRKNLQPVEAHAFPVEPTVLEAQLPALLERAEELAQKRADEIRAKAEAKALRDLGSEAERLERLAALNDHVSPAEVQELRETARLLGQAVKASRLRLDAIRLVA